MCNELNLKNISKKFKIELMKAGHKSNSIIRIMVKKGNTVENKIRNCQFRKPKRYWVCRKQKEIDEF